MGYFYNQKNLNNYPYLFSFYAIYLLLFLDFWVKLEQINLDFNYSLFKNIWFYKNQAIKIEN
jgi:hypothetical protein